MLKNKFEELFSVKTGGLNLGFRDFISYVFLPCKKFQHRKNQLDQAIKFMRERYDVIFLLKKIVELDKLKQVLLSDE